MNGISFNKILGLLVVIILVVGIIVTVIASRQQTQTQQHASDTVNLNTGADITSTNNLDGTMGPTSWQNNYSSSLPSNQVSSLIFLVSNVSSGDSSLPQTSKAVAQGPQIVKSLIIKISKVEVRLDSTLTNRNANHWETLNMPVAMSVDLAQLAQGGVASLGLTKLAAGNYSEVRLYVQSATAVLQNGNNVTLSIQNKDNIVRVAQPFSIASDKNTTLVMDFDVDHSVIYDGTNYLLKPVVAKLLENK